MTNASFMMQMRAQQRRNPVQQRADARQAARANYDKTGVIDPRLGAPTKNKNKDS